MRKNIVEEHLGVYLLLAASAGPDIETPWRRYRTPRNREKKCLSRRNQSNVCTKFRCVARKSDLDRSIQTWKIKKKARYYNQVIRGCTRLFQTSPRMRATSQMFLDLEDPETLHSCTTAHCVTLFFPPDIQSLTRLTVIWPSEPRILSREKKHISQSTSTKF